ncbi:hypothetical protein THAOC_25297, partial [Thalassiosira oceanica]
PGRDDTSNAMKGEDDDKGGNGCVGNSSVQTRGTWTAVTNQPIKGRGEFFRRDAEMNRIRIRRRQITCVVFLLLSMVTSTFAQFGLSKGTPMSVPDAGEVESGGRQDGFLSEEVGFRSE